MAHGGFKNVLQHGGFRAFLSTQFLGAFNDSVYQTIVGLRVLDFQGGVYVPLIPALFTLPSLLFSGYSGHLSDLLSKRRVMIWVKAFEIAIMSLALVALYADWIYGLLLVVFLMGLHAAVFGPAKYGIVPEILPDRDLSRGNALLEMSTFVAIVLGIASGGILFAVWKTAAWRIGVITLAVSLIGFYNSLRITKVPPSGATSPFRLNPFAEIGIGTRHLRADPPLWLAALGIAYFWFAGVLLKTDLQYFGKDVLRTGDAGISIIWVCLAIGIGAGNMLAGRLSGDKVELGLVPLGAALMGVFTLAIYFCRGSLVLSVIAVALMSIASGLFVVPLYAYIQQRSGGQEKGRVVATNNFYQTIGMMIASGLIWLCYTQLHLSASAILAGFGISMLLVTAYIVTVVPDYLLRFVLWLVTHTIFKIRIVGQENVPFRGPALLVANHTTYADGLLISACVQRFIRFMVWKPIYEMKSLNWIFRLAKAIPTISGSPRDSVATIRAAREQLAAGHMVCIFAEGTISRTGNMLPFKRGLEKIVDGADVPIIPVHLDRLWGSIFSFAGGRFFWKWPAAIPYPVTVSFGKPMPATSRAQAVRLAIQELGADAVAHRQKPHDTLDRRLIANARANWRRFAMADSTGRELTYGQMLTGGRLVANEVAKLPEAEMIGVLLPASVAGALVNIGITLAGRIPVNLNFTAGPDAVAAAIGQCKIQTIVTSKAFLAKAKLAQLPGMVYVEDLLGRATGFDKLRALLAARLLPAALLTRGHGTPNSLATVIFSSGSTGTPKGVMLSHYNLISNIEAIAQLFWIDAGDRIVGTLPFFHSFGFNVTIWFPLLSGCGVVYHPNPTDAKAIGEITGKYKGTFLVSTPTFCSTYTRKCTAEEFASLRYVLVGAEKLREPIAAAFREKFGVELLEGYGCTEMSPVVAVNVPNCEDGGNKQIGHKPGTVGHPLPGVAVRLVDPATFEPIPNGGEGLLLVKGSNRMIGYLGQPERTAEVFHDGWYVTGDIARIDDEGFLHITDRLGRFSKIAGEMVPHGKIEEVVATIIGDAPCAVTAVADEQRGERLVILYTQNGIGPADLWQRLSDTDLPRLWLPKRENIYPVDSLPVLGTGKLDLRGVKARAQALIG